MTRHSLLLYALIAGPVIVAASAATTLYVQGRGSQPQSPAPASVTAPVEPIRDKSIRRVTGIVEVASADNDSAWLTGKSDGRPAHFVLVVRYRDARGRGCATCVFRDDFPFDFEVGRGDIVSVEGVVESESLAGGESLLTLRECRYAK